MFEHLRRDYWASRAKGRATLARMLCRAANDSGFRAMCCYRLGRWCRLHRLRVAAVLLERVMHHLSHCWISTLAEIGPGFRIAHVCGIVVPPGVVFGADCEIRQNVTLGGNFDKRGPDGRTTPRLCDHVSLGPGAVVLGPIEVGAHTFIGANALVTQSVPAHSIVGAFRAEVIAQRVPDGSLVREATRVFLSRRELHERIETLARRVADLEKETTP